MDGFCACSDLRQEERRRIHVRRSVKNSGGLCFFVGFLGYVYFFNETEVVFECQKQTMRCEYYHATLYNKRLHLTHSFDFSETTDITVQRQKSFWRRRKRLLAPEYYDITFVEKNKSFRIPKSFKQKEAGSLASQIISFLKTDLPQYTYRESLDDSDESFIIFALFISAGLALFGSAFLIDKKKALKQNS